jgi:hypothetical protein
LRGARVSGVAFEGAWASASGARRKRREMKRMKTITSVEAWKNAEVSGGGLKGAEEK